MPSSIPMNSHKTRFFIALIPPQNIQDYANQVIAELNAHYQTRTSNAPPHITLQPPFLWQQDKVVELESCLQAFAQTRSTISVTLSNFGAFAPRVLFISVDKTPELLSLQAQMMACLENSLGIVDSMSKQRSFTPHLTVASRNLKRNTFRQAWAELQERQIEFSFISDRLTLLIHEGACWQIQAEFSFVKI